MHVLVVDDAPMIRQFLEMMLPLEGHSVSTAANGKQALERIAEQQPDVVLLDVMMPVMNGWEVQDYLREQNNPVPIVIMSTEAGFRAPAEARHASFLLKPFDLDELSRALASLTRPVS